MMKFSFVIISYNQKELVCKAIDSVLGQTYQEIEAILVDDASSDGTVEYVTSRYTDERLNVVALKENQGPMMARLAGMEQATGDWVLFLDSDDKYFPNACESLAKTIGKLKKPVDMIGYGVLPVYVGDVPEYAKNALEDSIMTPHLGYMSAQAIMDELYLKRSKSYSMWSKCYSRELCRKILGNVEREKLYFAEDFYFNFLACCLSHGYYGFAEKLYQYLYGVGISGQSVLSYSAFLRYLTCSKSHVLTEKFAMAQGLFERYKSTFQEMNSTVIIGAYDRLTRISEENRKIAVKEFIENFGISNVLAALANTEWIAQEQVANIINCKELFPFEQRKIENIAVVSSKYIDPIVQDTLTQKIAETPYHLFWWTARNFGQEKTGFLNSVLYSVSCGSEYYESFIRSIKECKIDLVIYCDWDKNSIFEDLAVIKSTGAAVMVCINESFAETIGKGMNVKRKFSSVFAQADGLVVLSEADCLYWSDVNQTTFCISRFYNDKIFEKISLNSDMSLKLQQLCDCNYLNQWARIIQALNSPYYYRKSIPAEWKLYKEACDMAIDGVLSKYTAYEQELKDVIDKNKTMQCFDYNQMTKFQRWIAYLFFDRSALKSILKFKIEKVLKK